MTPIPLDTLNAASAQDFVAALADIFEHSPWAAEAVASARPFGSVAALRDAMVAAVRAAGPERQRALLAAHPDLAGKAARAGDLTASSTAEQASAGLDRLSEDEYAAFHRLNDAYRGKHGIPFIVCVRRHTKASILRQFERRLASDSAAEHETALAEVFRIAALRLDQTIQAPDRLPLAGRLSTHVLDTHGGTPARGIPVTLYELGPGEARRVVATAVTNHDGRTDAPLIGGRPVPIGTYELVFTVAAYFAGRGVPLADPPFLDAVPLRFAVAEAEGHYHVPLLVTPWSFSTYRGS
ncbi:2-oxo-4-hydroxy-4-carboxy-5-ureidoimidazoline decarboxylase [Rhodoplanes sp. TEM]|uniref:2-oxo-4-hydroxy-4-carboxy-5-ureidoimidazoline decarboxylase n=1 Tax=Rhodoplanes tepidamans TaxID=200616 RepID=A0ABT5J452_RHOTP|nr:MULTISPECIES: 2-oxo-4-hydroxy-4-carboxy-5-ureidoimidazoline decarboxylase [Rhodoplanes]MDC7784406.1 2-oxo-4-hydroxy-4-carboxy-5-ureidoimidazoline decarboxylase [Rhodoplanes tepidamans]MDC7985185.1 2-oxo-4-hydroxy-4-carboxy-5-ureidoimidazoline decarboxylase [Rhodoplanes sp. TEM]MDQ0354465.1 2-oxo-4-hydroxy-4-carboxy-5-ureidoimidazoline decarboxylase [Rhodoplanes tepidamans]